MLGSFRPKQPGRPAESPAEYKDGGVSSFSYDKGTKNALLAIFAGTTLTGCFGAPTMPSTPEPSRPEATPPPPTQEFTPGSEHVVDPRDIKSVEAAVETLKAQSPDAGSLKVGEGYAQEIRSTHIVDKNGNTYLLVEYDLKVDSTYKGFSSPDGTGSIGVVFVDRDNKYISVKQYPEVLAPGKNEKRHVQEFFLTSLPSTASATAEGAVDIQLTTNPGLIKGIEGLQEKKSLEQIVRRDSKMGTVRTIAGYEITKNIDTFLSGDLFKDHDNLGLAIASRYQSNGEKPGFAFLGDAPPTQEQSGLSPYRR